MEKYELVYKINKNSSHLKLLGEQFCKKNKLLGHFIFNNKKFPLIDKIETKNIMEEELRLVLIFYEKIYDKSFMFADCTSLLKFSDKNNEVKEYNTKIIQITEEEEDNLFDYYNNNDDSEKISIQSFVDENTSSFSDYSSFEDIAKNKSNLGTIENIKKNLDIIPVITKSSMLLNDMFANCTSLISILGISSWNTSDVTDMRGLFFNCSSLVSLPDISNWNTSDVFKYEFNFC